MDSPLAVTLNSSTGTIESVTDDPAKRQVVGDAAVVPAGTLTFASPFSTITKLANLRLSSTFVKITNA